jgi:protein SCO1/2
MNKREFLKNATGASLGLATLAAVPSLAATSHKPHSKVALSAVDRRRGRFLNLPMVTHEGKVVRFYDDLIKDKIVLINFMYARCADNCPMTTANLKKVHKELGDRMGKDVFMYSVTLEPEHDTPEKLKSYAELFKTGPGWKFLTGTKDHIEQLRANLGFKNSNPTLDKDRTQHVGVVKFGIERLERWGMAPALSSPVAIAEYVNWLEPGAPHPSLEMLRGHFVDPGNITAGWADATPA